MPNTVLIRTDAHPQSLLDSRDLAFQGGALDGGKCYDNHRWWDIFFISGNTKQGNHAKMETTIYAFATYESRNMQRRQFLSVVNGQKQVGLESLDADDELPERAQWAVNGCGTAFSPGQVRDAALVVPVAVAAGAVTGGYGGAALGGAYVATVTTVGAVTAGAAAATTGVKYVLEQQASKEFFVDW